MGVMEFSFSMGDIEFRSFIRPSRFFISALSSSVLEECCNQKKIVTRKNKNTSRITLPSSQCNEQLYIVKCKPWNGNTVNPALFEICPCLSCNLNAAVSPVHPLTPYCEMASKYIGIHIQLRLHSNSGTAGGANIYFGRYQQISPYKKFFIRFISMILIG